MPTTDLCRRLRVDVPVVQAPIGSAASPELAAAVSEAGGLGMLAVTWLGEEGVRERIRQVRERTDRSFGVNLVLDFPVARQLDACLTEGVGIVSTFWGDPATVQHQIRTGHAAPSTPGSTSSSPRAGKPADTCEARCPPWSSCPPWSTLSRRYR